PVLKYGCQDLCESYALAEPATPARTDRARSADSRAFMINLLFLATIGGRPHMAPASATKRSSHTAVRNSDQSSGWEREMSICPSRSSLRGHLLAPPVLSERRR